MIIFLTLFYTSTREIPTLSYIVDWPNFCVALIVLGNRTESISIFDLNVQLDNLGFYVGCTRAFSVGFNSVWFNWCDHESLLHIFCMGLCSFKDHFKLKTLEHNHSMSNFGLVFFVV